MKYARTLCLVAATILPLAVGCKSDDDPVKASTEGTGGAGGSGGTGGNGAVDTDAGDSGANDELLPDIAGTYLDEFSQTQVIAEGTWKIDALVFHITLVENTLMFAIASNDADNPWSPGKWSRFDWTKDTAGDIYYCQTAYDAESEQAALATARADDSDLSTGCAGFSWSKLTPKNATDAGS